MTNEPTQEYQAFPSIVKSIRRLRSGDRILSAGIFARADAVETLIFDPASDLLRDSATHTRWVAVKRLVIRYWPCRLALLIRARRSVGKEISAALGPPDYYEVISGGVEREVREGAGELALAQRFRVEDGDVAVWSGVTLRFPGGRLRRVVVPGVRVTLIEPRLRTPAAARGPRQLSLGLGLE
jgi:hypothetical protein